MFWRKKKKVKRNNIVRVSDVIFASALLFDFYAIRRFAFQFIQIVPKFDFIIIFIRFGRQKSHSMEMKINTETHVKKTQTHTFSCFHFAKHLEESRAMIS